ncbi:thioesterase [Saccharopolyspora erythraea]|uniref:thioesterase II family protein n=1 Tax=Saccharopolyspora erythraea TaxID=1836 RepID=UPI001BAC16EA|nr:alpha/beta fold hydrolase [Saccharopolyspora erythraea]QUH01919.1 thioesterase [Saccharopolyspora erythraea]
MSDLAPGSWLRRYFPSPEAAVRLVCFPHAGGSASFYRPVASAHSTHADVVVLQYPGRQDRHRHPFIETIDDYADAITSVLASEPELPTAFFGHSMGATLAFEVAHRLELGAGRPPRALIVSGRRAPGTVREERVHESDDEGLLAELRRLNGTGAALDDEEIVRMSLPAIRNDYKAIETYPPRPNRSVSCPVWALVGDDDPKTTVDEALRWKHHTSALFGMRTFPGGHFYLTEHASAVNAEIRKRLDELEQPASSR